MSFCLIFSLKFPTDAEVKRSLAWLEHNGNGPELQEHWLATAHVRFELLKGIKGGVSEYFEKYPVTVDRDLGAQLIDKDFEVLFPSASKDFFVE